jgi:hypothetical protein
MGKTQSQRVPMVSLGARGWPTKGLHCLGLWRLYVQGVEWRKSTRGLWQRMLRYNYPMELRPTLILSISYSSVGVGKDSDEGD